MGCIVSIRDKNRAYAVELIAKAIKLDSTNGRLWFDYGVSNFEALSDTTARDTSKSSAYKENASKAFHKVIEIKDDSELFDKAKEYLKKIGAM